MTKQNVSDPKPAGDWWCPTCKEALPGSRVTYYERCGTPVTVVGDSEVERLKKEIAALRLALLQDRERCASLADQYLRGACPASTMALHLPDAIRARPDPCDLSAA